MCLRLSCPTTSPHSSRVQPRWTTRATSGCGTIPTRGDSGGTSTTVRNRGELIERVQFPEQRSWASETVLGAARKQRRDKGHAGEGTPPVESMAIVRATHKRSGSMFRRLLAFSALSIAFLAAGCLDSSGPGAVVPIEETSFASSLGVNLTQSTKTTNGMYYRDLVAGTGATVANGQSVSVWYTGWLSSGYEFDSNVGEATPFHLLSDRKRHPGLARGASGARWQKETVIIRRICIRCGGYGPFRQRRHVFNVDV